MTPIDSTKVLAETADSIGCGAIGAAVAGTGVAGTGVADTGAIEMGAIVMGAIEMGAVVMGVVETGVVIMGVVETGVPGAGAADGTIVPAAAGIDGTVPGVSKEVAGAVGLDATELAGVDGPEDGGTTATATLPRLGAAAPRLGPGTIPAPPPLQATGKSAIVMMAIRTTPRGLRIRSGSFGLKLDPQAIGARNNADDAFTRKVTCVTAGSIVLPRYESTNAISHTSERKCDFESVTARVDGAHTTRER